MATVDAGEIDQLDNGAPHSSLHYHSLRVRPQRRDSEEEDGVNGAGSQQAAVGFSNKKLRLAVRTAIAVVLFLVVLGCVTFSKLSLVALADRLRNMTVSRTKEEVCFVFLFFIRLYA